MSSKFFNPRITIEDRLKSVRGLETAKISISNWKFKYLSFPLCHLVYQRSKKLYGVFVNNFRYMSLKT